MVSIDTDRVRDTLRKEIPAFKAAGDGLIGALTMLLGSVGLSSMVGVGTFWLLFEMLEVDYEDTTLTTVMLLSPVLGFIIGFFTRDTLLLPGQTDRSASDYEIGKDSEGFGCLLYFLHMLASSVYFSFAQLFSTFKKDLAKELELSVSIVSYLLQNGEAPTSKLAESLTDQGVPRERVRETLNLLRQERIVEPDENTLRLLPSVRMLFV